MARSMAMRSKMRLGSGSSDAGAGKSTKKFLVSTGYKKQSAGKAMGLALAGKKGS